MGYKSDAQRKAVHASKADGGAGNPNKMKSGFKMAHTDGKKSSPAKFFGFNTTSPAGRKELNITKDSGMGDSRMKQRLSEALNRRAEQKAEETIEEVVNNESEEGLV
tara:strand:- start:2648 stop:2968 length:321 start_codon:yes stop_codon:yes gene_type:complete